MRGRIVVGVVWVAPCQECVVVCSILGGRMDGRIEGNDELRIEGYKYFLEYIVQTYSIKYIIKLI